MVAVAMIECERRCRLRARQRVDGCSASMRSERHTSGDGVLVDACHHPDRLHAHVAIGDRRYDARQLCVGDVSRFVVVKGCGTAGSRDGEIATSARSWSRSAEASYSTFTGCCEATLSGAGAAAAKARAAAASAQ